MTKIAQATDGNCTTRAISTMRLALGYKDALPSNWKSRGLWTSELVSVIGDCFPNREVVVVCSEEIASAVTFTNRARYVGTVMSCGAGGDAPAEVSIDHYLFAFVYCCDRVNDESHIVIGTPVGFGSGEDLEDIELSLVFAVSLEENKGKLRRMWAQFLKSVQRWSDFVCAKGLTKRCAGGIMTVEE